jgi:hypothetical protein
MSDLFDPQNIAKGLEAGIRGFLQANEMKQREMETKAAARAREKNDRLRDLSFRMQAEKAGYNIDRDEQGGIAGVSRDQEFLQNQKDKEQAQRYFQQGMAAQGKGLIAQFTPEQRGLMESQGYGLIQTQKSPEMLAEEAREKQKEDLQIQKLITDARTSGNKLMEKWLNNETTKDSRAVAVAYEKVKNAANDPSAAGDLALIFNYMKMLDPGSVVREGEFATAQNATGVPDRVRNYYNRAIQGTRLGKNQRADFINQAKNAYQGQMNIQNKLNSSFRNLATKQGFKADQVVLPELFAVEDSTKVSQEVVP